MLLNSVILILSAALLFMPLPVTAGSCGGPVPCACGDTVVTNTTLSNADPITATICPLDGLFVAPGVTLLDGGGLTLTGARRGDGIKMLGAGVTVQNLTVDNFLNGIEAFGLDHQIVTDVTVTRTRYWCVVLNGNNQTITNSVGLDNDGRCFRIKGNTGAVVTGNRVERTRGYGINVNTDNVMIADNVALDGGSDGIHTDGSNKQVLRNISTGNRGHGIMTDDAAGDLFEDNYVAHNTNHGLTVLTGPTSGITLRNNVAERNTKDGIHVVGDGVTLIGNRGDQNGAKGINADAGNLDGGGNTGTGNGGIQCQINGVPCQ